MVYGKVMNDSAQAILDDWFGPRDAEGKCAKEKVQRWFRGGPEFDAYLSEQYGALVDEAVGGGLTQWEADPLETVALILLLDQFTRNVFRNTPRMYQGDERARTLALRLLDDETKLEQVPFVFRSFVCMPLMHAETKDLQDRSLSEFERLLATAPPALRQGSEQSLEYAKQHRDIVHRFGRFPHRNEILGRPTTAEEAEFLKTPGSAF